MTTPLERTSELYLAAMTPPQVYTCLKTMQRLLWTHGFAGACLVISPEHHAWVHQLPRGLVIRGEASLTIDDPAVRVYEAHLAAAFRDCAQRMLQTASVLEQAMPWDKDVSTGQRPAS